MRKHFLLLFLMALLPLAGWAYTYEVDVEVKPYNASVKWSGVKPSGVDASWIGAPGSSLTTAVKTAIATQLEINDLADYNAGIHDYYLQLKSTAAGFVEDGDTRYNIRLNDANKAQLTIEKFTGNPVFGGTLAFVEGDLTYTGQPQALLQTGATATANGFPVPVVYATSETAENWVALADLKETNANTTGYTVYYKVVGTDNYAGSAVQTMVGTKAIAKATITFNLSAATGLTYNGAPQALLALTDNTKPATNFGASTLQYKIDAAEAWAELPEAGIDGITGTSAKNGVAYSINLKVPADENGNWDETTITAPIATTIAKATPVITAAPAVTEDLTYTGENQNLLSGPAIIKLGETTLDIQVKYLIKRKKDGLSGTPYSSGIIKYAYDAVTGNHASTDYDIQQSTQATDDLNAAVTVSTHKAIGVADYPADWYTWQEGKTLRVADAAQELVTPATWNTTKRSTNLEYRVSNNNESSWSEWNAAVPTSNTVGTYIVQCRLVPVPVEGAYDYSRLYKKVTTTIAAKAQVTVTTVANQSFGYGTTPTIQKTVVWEEQGTDVLNEAGLAWAWYTNSDCTTPATVDGNGNYAVGDYYVKAYGATVTGTTAASQNIVYVPALVKITAGQVTAKISATATYGSLPEFTLTHVSGLSPAEAATFNATNNLSKVTIKKDGAVVNNLANVAKDDANLATLAAGEYDLEATASCGDNYAVVVSAGTLTVSAKSIADAVITVTTAADDIVYNNKAWGTVNPIAFTVDETSGIEAADYDVTYSNNVNAGTATITLTGKKNYAGTKTQNFTIKKAALTIKADDTTWTYGTTEPTYAVTVEGQAEGETALEVGGNLAGIDGALTVVRTSNETVGMHTGALVAKFGTAQPAESDNYTITYPAGNLQVVKGAVVIQLKEAVTATYGDDPATSINAAIKNIANYEYVSGLSELEAANFASFIDVAAATFELTETKPQVGTDYNFAIAGATSTNYGVTINPGTYNVNPANITLYANNQAIDWSDTDSDNDAADTEVKAATVTIAAGELKYTDALTDVVASIVIASQNVGTNNISLTAAENANYNIFVNSDGTNAKYGVLTVIGAGTLAMTSKYNADDNWFSTIQSYDGKPVTVKLTVNRTQTLLSGKTYTWKGEEWNAFILPFDITPKQLSDAFGYAIVNVVNPSASTADNIAFKLQMSGTIPANTPFMLKNYEAVAPGTTITLGDFEIDAPASKEVSVDAGAGWKFIGTYDKKTINNSNTDVYYYNGEGAWKHLGASSTNTWNIAPFNAYMLQPAGSSAREITFTFEDLGGGTTAIKSISEDATGTNAKGWYDLKGMKMENAPTQKGVYIKDGKKVVIK